MNKTFCDKGTPEWKIVGYTIQTLSDMMFDNPIPQAEKPTGITKEKTFESCLLLLDAGVIYLCEEEGGFTFHTIDWFEENGKPLPKVPKKYRELFSGHYDDWK